MGEPGIKGDSSHSNTQGLCSQECEVSEESCHTESGLVYEKLSEGGQGQNSEESCDKERKHFICEEFIEKEKDLITGKACEEVCDVISNESCDEEHDLISEESSEKDEIGENTDTFKHNSSNSSPILCENHQTKDLSCDYNDSEGDIETENVELESGKEDVKEIYSTSDTNAFNENLSNTDISETYVSEYDEDEWGSDWGQLEENEYEFLECDEDEYKV